MARCPICRNEATADYRPFCSRRCADVDLGRWLTGSYAVPGPAASPEPPAPPPSDEADRD